MSPLLPDPTAARQAHARLSVLLPARFYSPLRMDGPIEDDAPLSAATRVYRALIAAGGETRVRDLAEATGLHHDTVNKACVEMAKKGKLERGPGRPLPTGGRSVVYRLAKLSGWDA